MLKRSTPLAVAMLMPALAAAEPHASPEAAVSSILGSGKFVEWTSTDGDWNGDGIKDRAMIVKQADGPVDEPPRVRLIVLAGVAGGKFIPLSVSGNYCLAQKFHDLAAKGPFLSVTEVHRADGEGMASETHQFRFNPTVSDMELIGRDNIWESSSGDYGRLRIDYLKSIETEYRRKRGRIHEVKRTRLAAHPSLVRLNGFDCESR